MSTLRCPSTAVVNVSVALAGMVELRWMSFETTPPIVSMPSDRGVTSSSNLSSTCARKDAGLNRRAQRDHFVRIQFGVRLGAEQRFHRLPDQRDPRRPAHQHNFVDLLHASRPHPQAVHGTAPSVRSTIGVISWSNSVAR